MGSDFHFQFCRTLPTCRASLRGEQHGRLPRAPWSGGRQPAPPWPAPDDPHLPHAPSSSCCSGGAWCGPVARKGPTAKPKATLAKHLQCCHGWGQQYHSLALPVGVSSSEGRNRLHPMLWASCHAGQCILCPSYLPAQAKEWGPEHSHQVQLTHPTQLQPLLIQRNDHGPAAGAGRCGKGELGQGRELVLGASVSPTLGCLCCCWQEQWQ